MRLLKRRDILFTVTFLLLLKREVLLMPVFGVIKTGYLEKEIIFIVVITRKLQPADIINTGLKTM